MPWNTWREGLVEADLPAGLADLFDELAEHGWYCRGRRGEHGVAVWPDGGRGRQITVDTRYPVNEHRLDEIRRFTELPQLLSSGNQNSQSSVER